MSDTTDDTLTPGEVAVRTNQFARMAATHHTCSGMPGCAACYVDLHAKIAAAETRERTWSLALQSLTPGGSEYADDPEACVKFVREARESQHQQILSLVKDLKHLREQAGPDSCADQVVRRIEAEKRAEEAERLYTEIANPKCLNDACGHLWREHEASSEDCEEPCLVAGCPCDAFEGESAAARFAALTSQLSAANAEIERLMARPVDDHPGWESARETMFDAHERQRAAQERS